LKHTQQKAFCDAWKALKSVFCRDSASDPAGGAHTPTDLGLRRADRAAAAGFFVAPPPTKVNRRTERRRRQKFWVLAGVNRRFP